MTRTTCRSHSPEQHCGIPADTEQACTGIKCKRISCQRISCQNITTISHCGASPDDDTCQTQHHANTFCKKVKHARGPKRIAQRRFPFNSRLPYMIFTSVCHSRHASPSVPPTASEFIFAAKTLPTTVTATYSVVTPVGRSTSTSACASAPATRCAHAPP